MPGTNQTSSENLSHIISDILHLKAPGKRQLESNRACPEVWVKHVQDDDEEEEEEEICRTNPKSFVQRICSTDLLYIDVLRQALLKLQKALIFK